MVCLVSERNQQAIFLVSSSGNRRREEEQRVFLVKLLTDESTTLPTIEAFSPKVTITVSTLKRVNEVDVGEFIDFPDNQFNMDPLNIYFM